MQITKELLDNEIITMQSRLEQAKAQLANINGALATLQDLRRYLDVLEVEPNTAISPENAAIQARDEAAQAAVVPVPIKRGRRKTRGEA